MNIYAISEKYAYLLNKEELDENDEAALDVLPEQIEDEAIERVKIIKNLEAELSAVINEHKKMYERAKKLEKSIERKKEFLIKVLQKSNMVKITKSPLFTITIATNPAHVHEYDTAIIPRDYYKLKETYTLDKTLIKNDILKGIEVPGARLEHRHKLVIE